MLMDTLTGRSQLARARWGLPEAREECFCALGTFVLEKYF